MKDVTDVIGWIIGGLTTLVFFGWRYDKREVDKQITIITDRQRDGLARMSVIEAKVDGIQAHYIQTLEDIKAQNIDMAKDVIEIKLAIASLPKRKRDGE